MADVFISYSRLDGEFVRRLTSALQEHGKDVWTDVEGIRDAEVFPEALRRAIESSDTFAFVISPESVRSSFCAEEIEHAARLHKRIVPLLRAAVPAVEVPEDVRVRNWIPAGEDDDFTIVVARLVKALDTDLEWERQHSRLTVRALEWERSERDRSFLLRGADLKTAERWLAEGVDKDPGPTALETEYVVAARSRTRRARLLVSAVSFVVLALIAVLVALLAAPGPGVRVRANSVAVIDPHEDRVVGQAPVGVAPGSIAAGVGGVWVANTGDHTISNIDPASHTVVRTLSFGNTVDGVAADSRSVWTVDSTRGVAARVDLSFGTLVAPAGVGDQPGLGFRPNPIAVSGGVAWVANDGSQVLRIPGNGRVSRIDVGNGPSGIAIGEGAAWVADDFDNTVSRIDAAGRVSRVIPVGPGASGIAVGGGAVWVVDTLANQLERIDPSTDSVRTIAVGSRPRGVAWGDGSVWVANSGDGTVSRIDPHTDRVAATIRVGQSPQALVVTAGAVWVSIAASPPAHRSPSGSPPGVLRVARSGPFGSTDPAVGPGNGLDPQQQQVFHETCAGLVSYPDRPAPEGTRLVPEVARSMPTVSADGRTYTFLIRPGFRFSPPSGAPVTAATLKHTIERVLSPKMRAYIRNFMGDIVGMRAYQAGRTHYLAGVTASGDRLQIRLTAPAPDLLARLATTWFCAVPDNTPMTGQTRSIPSAGPYYVTSSTHDQLVLARNPNYTGHRPRIPKQIVYSFNVTLPTAVQDVETGRSDYLNSAGFYENPAAALEARYGPASPRRERATSGTSSPRGRMSTTSSSTPRVPCLPPPACAARSTTRSTAGRSWGTTSPSSEDRRPTITCHPESLARARWTYIRSGVQTSPRRDRWRAGFTPTPPCTRVAGCPSAARTRRSSRPTSRRSASPSTSRRRQAGSAA